MWPRLIDKFRQFCGYGFPRLGPLFFAAIFKTLPSRIETRLFPGIKADLDLRDETQRTTYWFGTRFEHPTPKILQAWAVDATHFFDIGSNYGFYSLFLYSLFPHLSIYPFEPNPAPFGRLLEICRANDIASVHPQAYGLADLASRLQFLQLQDNTGHSSFATVEPSHSETFLATGACLIECDVMPFDEATKRLALEYPVRPSWIAKIDVEGYEMKVLKGMTDALRKKAFKGICIELVADNLALVGTSMEEVRTLLRNCGYDERPRQHLHQDDGRNHNCFFVPQ